MRRLALTLRMGFALLLLATGIAKWLDLPGFYSVVASYRVFPEGLLAPAGLALATGEVGLAAWLASGWQVQRAALAVIVLHLLYLSWILLALVRGLTLANCGCFGVFFARPLRWWTPVEDAVLIGLAVLLWSALRNSTRRLS